MQFAAIEDSLSRSMTHSRSNRRDIEGGKKRSITDSITESLFGKIPSVPTQSTALEDKVAKKQRTLDLALLACDAVTEKWREVRIRKLQRKMFLLQIITALVALFSMISGRSPWSEINEQCSFLPIANM
eukprot:1209379-Rhodomonas_salina.2